MTSAVEASLALCILRYQPFGTPTWTQTTAHRLGLGLESTLRPRGRPRKEPNNGS